MGLWNERRQRVGEWERWALSTGDTCCFRIVPVCHPAFPSGQQRWIFKFWNSWDPMDICFMSTPYECKINCTPAIGIYYANNVSLPWFRIGQNMFTFYNYATEVNKLGASLVAQWLRICLLMQGTRVRALVWEDPTCCGATRPVSHNYWTCASGACAPQQERPW